MPLQIANITAIAIIALTFGVDREYAERVLSGLEAGPVCTIDGCKLSASKDARGDLYYSLYGYDTWSRDVDRVLVKADALVASWSA